MRPRGPFLIIVSLVVMPFDGARGERQGNGEKIKSKNPCRARVKEIIRGGVKTKVSVTVRFTPKLTII